MPSIHLLEDNSTNSNSGKQELTNVSTVISTAALSQIPLTAEDHVNDPSLFPPGVVDEHQQQVAIFEAFCQDIAVGLASKKFMGS